MRYRVKDGDRSAAQGTFTADLDELGIVLNGSVSVALTYESDYRGYGFSLDDWQITELDIGYDEDGAFWKSEDPEEIALCLAVVDWFSPELAAAIESCVQDKAEDLAKNPPDDDWDL